MRVFTEGAEGGLALAEDHGVEEGGVGVAGGEFGAAGDYAHMGGGGAQDAGGGFDETDVPEIDREAGDARAGLRDLGRELEGRDVEVGLEDAGGGGEGAEIGEERARGEGAVAVPRVDRNDEDVGFAHGWHG
jgi:hypothetical protein